MAIAAVMLRPIPAANLDKSIALHPVTLGIPPGVVQMPNFGANNLTNSLFFVLSNEGE
jgi:hypothetical protein